MNKVLLIGNLGAAPAVKESNGVTFCRFSLATNEYWKDRAGVRHERTDWHTVVAFSGLAKSLAQLAKGERVAVEGKLRVKRYEKDGEARYSVEVHADAVEFLSPRDRNRGAEPDPEPEPGYGAPGESDEDIPF